MKGLHVVAWILLVIGGLNWLLYAFNGAGIGAWISMGVMKVIYILVGLAALLELFTHKNNCKTCAASSSSPMGQPMK